MADIVFTARFKQQVRNLFGSVFEQIQSTEIMAKLGALQLHRTKARTARGEDIHGAAFTPYSEMWAANRKARGRQTGHVDLNDSGRMYVALQADAEVGSVHMFFGSDQAAKAHGHQMGVTNKAPGWGPTPSREFFGFGKGDVQELVEELRRAL